ncbi:GNAT family N-acetyltransferase [Kordia sp.]|uniref:GNAT family N-acetyltransferase n=1 Tax=Kordia sp. TaxID=1965332 RepID=UPI003B5B9EE0
MHIEITTKPNEADAKAISKGIVDFNNAKVPDLEPLEAEVKFFVFARNEHSEIVGGIRATCFWNTLHIELLWLSEECRGKGIGKQLMDKAEHFAKEQNCEKVFVETTSWQAKPFYEKVGYTHIATINDRPKGHASHYLTKDL